MSRKFFVATALLCALAYLLSGQRPPRATAQRLAVRGPQGLLRDAALEGRIREALAGTPLEFEQNVGQFDPRFEFAARGGNFMLVLNPHEAALHIHTAHMREKRPPQLEPEGLGWADAMAASALVQVKFAGGNPAAKLKGLDSQPGRINYIKGSDRNRWYRNVPHFGRVRYEGLYPGVDAVFYGDRRQMEFDFVVAPGADPSAIRMHVEGAASVELTQEGGLLARTPAGIVALRPPRLYQQHAGGQSEVAGHYLWRAPGEIGFEVATYDRSQALVIDPQASVKGPGARRAVVNHPSGRPHGKNGPPPDSPPPTGGSIALSTLLGGSYDDSIQAIAIGATAGHVYVAGFTDSYDFPYVSESSGYGNGGTPYANCQIPQSPCGDAFVAEFDVSTITAPQLINSVYIGGSNDDVAWGMVLDSNDDPYIIGQTDSLDFPTSENALQTPYGGTLGYPVPNSSCGTGAQPRACHHVFFSALSYDLSELYFSTYLAGSDDDEGYAVAVDSNDNAYLTGAAGEYFPTSAYACIGTDCEVTSLQPYYNGGGDAFVAEISDPGCPDCEGGQLLFSTYMGGYETDAGLAIAVDNASPANVFVGGVTFSTIDGTFEYDPSGSEGYVYLITEGSMQEFTNDSATCGPGYVFTCGDGFVVELSNTGDTVNYGTFVGGSGADQVNALLVNQYEGIDVIAVTGQTQTAPTGEFGGVSNFVPVQNCIDGCGGGSPAGPPFQATNGGGYDAFLAVFSPGFEIYATYLGGQYDDIGLGIASDANGDIFISGSTASGPCLAPACEGGFPGANPLQSQTNAGNYGNSPSTSFVSVFGITGNLLFSTYYGGLYDYYGNYPTDVGTSIALDSSGQIYLAGRTTSYANASNTPGSYYGTPGLCLTNQVPNANQDSIYYNDYNGFVAIINPQDSASACFSPALVTSLPSGPVPLTFSYSPTLQNMTSPQTQTLTIYDQGSAALSDTFTFSGANPGDFPLSSPNCTLTGSPGGFTVPAGGGSCQLTVGFTPVTAAAESTTLVISDNANCPASHPCTVSLQGQGLPPATVTLTPSPLNFPGSTPVGMSSAYQIVTLTDTSTTSYVDIASSSITGTNPNDFSIYVDECSGTQVQANGGVCFLLVTFTPQATGARTATLSVMDDGVGSPQSITLNGTGTLSPPIATIPPLSLTFAPQGQGTTSTAQMVTVTNTAAAGADNLIVAQPLTFTGANPGDFAATGCTTPVAPAGGTCMISVTFTPTATGARSATLQIMDNATNSPQTIGVSGTGQAGPTATPSGTVTFPSQVVNTTSAPMNETLTNSGGSPLGITNIMLTGGNAGDFAIFSNGCGTSLAAGSNCVVALTFTPTATGMRSTSLQFTDNATGSPQSVTINGTGATGPTAALTASITFATAQQINTTSASMPATLTNSGGAALPITSIGTTGDFAVVSNNCGNSLAADSSCMINITFTPTAAGARTGTLTVIDSVGTQTTMLMGTGLTPPAVTLTPATSAGNPLTFGTQAVGVTSGAMTVTLMNTGGSALNINAIAPTGDFAVTDNCQPSVAGSGMCTISVTFTPSGVGTRTGSILIVDNAASSPQTIFLSGTGSSSVPGFNISAPLYFGAVLVGSTSTPQTITITNAGGAPLTVTSATASAQFGVPSNTCGTVPIGQSCMISVTFSPTATGPQTGTLTIVDNAPGSPHSVSLSGIGATINIAPPAGGTNSLTVTPGDTAQYNLSVTGTPGLVVTLNLTCVSSAPYTKCSVSPATVTLGGANSPSVLVTVQTNCNPGMLVPPSGPFAPPALPAPFGALWLATIVLYVLLRRLAPQSRLSRAAPVLFLMLLMITWVGCASNPPPAIPGAPTTPAGVYGITVMANGSNVTQQVQLTLRVI